jgi:hypothetical protein
MLGPKIDIDGLDSVWLLPWAKRQLARFKKLFKFGKRQWNLPTGEEVTIWWGMMRDRIRITAAGGTGFLVLYQTASDPDTYEGWGFDSTGTYVKKVNIPQADEQPVSGEFVRLDRYWRGQGYGAGYWLNDDDINHHFRVFFPANDTMHDAYKALSWPGDGRGGARTYTFGDKGRFFGYSGSTLRVYGFDSRQTTGHLTLSLSSTLGQTEIGSTGTVDSAVREMPAGKMQYACRRWDTDVAGMYVQNYAITPPLTAAEGSIVEDGSPTTVFSRNYRDNNGYMSGLQYAVPHALGAVSVLSMSYTDGGATDELRYGGSFGQGTPFFGTLGLPNWVGTTGTDSFGTPTITSTVVTPSAITMTISGSSFTLHDDAVDTGQAYMAHVYAYPVFHGGYDYWHVYVPTYRPDTSAGTPDILAGTGKFTLNTYVIKANALGATGVGQQTTTLIDPASSVQSDLHRAYFPLGAATIAGQVWIAGIVLEFRCYGGSKPENAKAYPAQWRDDLSVVNKYTSGVSTIGILDEDMNSPRSYAELAMSTSFNNDPTTYVSADETGTYLIFTDSGLKTVLLGSADAPVTRTGPGGGTHISAPHFSSFALQINFPESTGRP